MRRAAFPVPGVIRHREPDIVGRGVIVRPARCRPRRFAGERPLAVWAAILRSPLEPEIADLNVRGEVQSCLALARSTQALVAAGDRLKAARAAVELVKAYDRVLESIRLAPLSLPEQQRVRDSLAPVAELLRRYRLR